MDTDSELSDLPEEEIRAGRNYAQILCELRVEHGTAAALNKRLYSPKFVRYKRLRLLALRQSWVAVHGTCGRCADGEGREVIYEYGFPAHRYRSLGPWDVCDICPSTDLCFRRFGDPEEWDGSPLDPETDDLVQVCLCCSYRYIPFPAKQKLA